MTQYIDVAKSAGKNTKDIETLKDSIGNVYTKKEIKNITDTLTKKTDFEDLKLKVDECLNGSTQNKPTFLLNDDGTILSTEQELLFDVPETIKISELSESESIEGFIPISQGDVTKKANTSLLVTQAEFLDHIKNHPVPEPPECDIDLSNYYTKSESYNKTEVNSLVDSINIPEINLDGYYTKEEIDSQLKELEFPGCDITKDEVTGIIKSLNVDQYAKEIDLFGGLLEPLAVFSLSSKSVIGTRALSIYDQARIMIEAGSYEKEKLTKQLDRYLSRNVITQEEYDELIALMEV